MPLFSGGFSDRCDNADESGGSGPAYNHERQLACRGLIQVSGFSVVHSSLAPKPLTGLDLDAELSAVVDLQNQKIGLSEGLFGLNDLEFRLDGEVESYGKGLG